MKIGAKILILPSLILLGLVFASVYYWPSEKLTVYFCDVGQGDGMYIKAPNGADIVIDGGPNNRILACIGKFMPFYDRKIELLVLTHPEKDHFYGLIELVKRYQVQNLVTVPVGNTSEDYQKFLETLKDKKLNPRYFTAGEKITLEDLSIYTMWPDKDWLVQQVRAEGLYESLNTAGTKKYFTTEANNKLNDFSLYLLLTYKDFDLLLTGDGDQRIQPHILQTHVSLLKPIEVLKVPHHGSKTAILVEMVEILKPKVSVFQVGKNNYGHPSAELIKNLETFGKIMRTDQHGTVKLETDGKKFTITPEKPRN